MDPVDKKIIQMKASKIQGSNTLKNKKIKEENLKRIQGYKKSKYK